MTEPDSRHRAVGRIVRPHGIRGEVVVDVRTDSPEERFADGTVLRAVFRGGEARELTIVATRPHSGRLLTTFTGIADRTDAEPLAGAILTVDVTALPLPDDPEEYHDHQLEGLAVRTVGGERLGIVREVLHGPAGELLAVHCPDGREVLVPFVHRIVPEIDLAAGELRVDPPDGLFEE